MYSDKVKKRTLLIVLLLVACIIVCLLVGQSIRAGGKNLQEESAGAIRETIRTAARQCYVVEGVYPLAQLRHVDVERAVFQGRGMDGAAFVFVKPVPPFVVARLSPGHAPGQQAASESQ